MEPNLTHIPSNSMPAIPSSSGALKQRSNSCVENNKLKCNITSERLAILRRQVENAIREHKIFTVRGGWAIIRNELLKRNWIEKYDNGSKNSKNGLITNNNKEDITMNLPQKQAWESLGHYIDKCEKTIMSRMLQNFDVDFYWTTRRDQTDMLHRSNANKIISRFNRTLFSSKEGLTLLLQQHSVWCTQPGISQVNYPRCYVLGFPDHYSHFVDDFRLTACMSLLKWLVWNFEQNKSIVSPEGRICHSVIQFALDRSNEYIDSRKHLDIDRETIKVWDHEWDIFLTNFYRVIHGNALFVQTRDFSFHVMYNRCKKALMELAKVWPELKIDGMKNIWILKPGNKCRGRGIQLIKTIEEVEKVLTLKIKYVVQKYIERPLLIYKTKFDIRQWFIVTSSQPLTIWMYRECYLRFSSQIFNLDNFHESYHLTNHAVQCKYKNMEQRDKALPHDNMWDSNTYQKYLKQIGYEDKWTKVTYPGIKQAIICSMLSSQDVMDRRSNTFELYGADFMISEDFEPWLIEINCSPDLSCSTTVTKRLCPQCLIDLMKVIIDRKNDPDCDTGSFDLIYKQNFPKVPPYLGTNLLLRGRKLHKNRNKKLKEKFDEKKDTQTILYKRLENYKNQIIKNKTAKEKKVDGGDYKGPIIEDLINELQKTVGNGVKFMVADKKRSEKNLSNIRVPNINNKFELNKTFFSRSEQSALNDKIIKSWSSNKEKHEDKYNLVKSKNALYKKETNKNFLKFSYLNLDFNLNHLLNENC